MATTKRPFLLALAVLVTGCSGQSPTASQLPSVVPTSVRQQPVSTPRGPTATAASSTPRPTPSVEPPGTGRSVIVADRADDLVDQDERHARGPRYVDIRRLQAEVSGDDLTFVLTVAADLPEGQSALVELLNYVVVLETTGDGDWDFWITYENRESGSWSPSMTDWGESMSYFDERFPGAVVHADDGVIGRIPLDRLGDPGAINICAVTQRASPDGDVTAEDNTPDGDCLGGTYATLTSR